MKTDTVNEFNIFLSGLGIESEEEQYNVRAKYGFNADTMKQVMEVGNTREDKATLRQQILSNGLVDWSAYSL